jgi:hypothetical protein
LIYNQWLTVTEARCEIRGSRRDGIDLNKKIYGTIEAP